MFKHHSDDMTKIFQYNQGITRPASSSATASMVAHGMNLIVSGQLTQISLSIKLRSSPFLFIRWLYFKKITKHKRVATYSSQLAFGAASFSARNKLTQINVTHAITYFNFSPEDKAPSLRSLANRWVCQKYIMLNMRLGLVFWFSVNVPFGIES